MITNAKVTDDFVYKVLETMAKNKDDLVAVRRRCGVHAGRSATRNTARRIIPGALKYFRNAISAKADG